MPPERTRKRCRLLLPIAACTPCCAVEEPGDGSIIHCPTLRDELTARFVLVLWLNWPVLLLPCASLQDEGCAAPLLALRHRVPGLCLSLRVPQAFSFHQKQLLWRRFR